MIPRRVPAVAFVCALGLLAAPVRAAIDCSGANAADQDVAYETNAQSVCIAAKNAEAAAEDSLRRLQSASEQLNAADPNSLNEARANYNKAKTYYDARMKELSDAHGRLTFLSVNSAYDYLSSKILSMQKLGETAEKRVNDRTKDSGQGPDGTSAAPGTARDTSERNDIASIVAGLPNNQNTPAVLKAAQSLNSGNPAAAEKSMDQALALDQNDPAALAMRAQARMAQGNREGALTDARQAVRLNPKDKASRALASELEGLSRASAKIKGAKLDFGADRAPEDASDGDHTRGWAAGGSPRAGAPDKSPGAAAQDATAPPAERSLIQRAEQLGGIGDFTGAMLPLREALDLNPRRPQLWDMLAEISNKTGNFKGALAAAESALKLDPSDARALRAKSFAEFSLGDYRQALADADRAVQLDPENGLSYLYRAMAEEKLGDTEKALADYRKAGQLDPTVAPLAEEGVKRLGGGAPAGATGSFLPRYLLRGGVLATSTALILLGLMGAAVGRRLTTRGRKTAAPSFDRADPPETVAIGARLGGNYRVTRELGRGGMGVVYQAYDETLQRHVAIKQLQREGRSNPEDIQRFLREARLVAQLKHPHMAQILSVINDDGLLLVFEFVEGQTLDRALSSERKFAPEKVRRLIGQICGALAYAHGRKIIHRDLKPSNVMLDAAGQAKIMDFGIAHQSRNDASLTKTGISGTPPYMAPEQAFGSVSKSADLYSLAVMTYEMLTGVRPFSGPDFMEPKLRGQFVPPASVNPALPRAIDGFFVRALHPDPTKRHADAAEFARALNEALATAPHPA
jgi:tetratricopeptide (TPR) repeat protein